MLALVLAQTASGLFATDGDFYSGPLNDLISARAGNQVTEFHELNFNVLLLVIIVHIAAAFFYLLFKHENLIAAMITGRKNDPSGRYEAIDGSQSILAGIVLLAVAAGVYALVTFV
jgi:cytochrome b